MRTLAKVAVVGLLCGAVACAPPLPDGNQQGRCQGKCEPAQQGTTEAGLGPEWPADWTLLIFAANDDKDTRLVAAFDEDAEEIRQGLGGSALFRIMMQRDYADYQRDQRDVSRQSERFVVYREQQMHPARERAGEAGALLLGETDTSDPQVLEDFLVAGIRRFPARRYWVIVTGHGDGWHGIAHDATTKRAMSLDGLSTALRNASAVIANEIRATAGLDGAHLSRKIDVVQFDACRLGQAEVMASLADSADYMVASQEIVPNAGHPYSALRAVAQDHTRYEPKTIVREVVADYVRSYVEGVSTHDRAYVGQTVSAFAVDLRKSQPLVDAIGDFSRALLRDRPAGLSCLEAAAVDRAAAERAGLYLPEPGEGAGRVIGAADFSSDMVALFEVFAGNQLVASRFPVSCQPRAEFAPTEVSLGLSNETRRAALRVLDIIGRPHIASKWAACGGSTLQYDGQYRQLSSFEARGAQLGDATIESPFVIEAHKVSSRGQRTLGMALFWGANPYDLTYRRDGKSALDAYLALPFERASSWSRVMDQCIQQALACRNWDTSQSADPCAYARQLP